MSSSGTGTDLSAMLAQKAAAANTTVAGLLGDRDYDVFVDRSGSMGEAVSRQDPTSRWDAVRELVGEVLYITDQFDPDGSTLGFFSRTSDFKVYENVTRDRAMEIYRTVNPDGNTNAAPAFQHSFNAYLASKRDGSMKKNGRTVVIVTDGIFDDKDAVERAIVNFCKEITAQEADTTFGIAILQIGDNAGATDFLTRLDDGLSRLTGGKDVIDVKTARQVAELGLEAVLVEALVG